MIDVLHLRFDAPLLCFGGVAIDALRVTWRMPGRAMLTGLIGNALGYCHFDADRLNDLQSRLRYAARCDRAGKEIVDFQTADLSQAFLSEGWTTRGAPEGREGGTAREGTHIRLRSYLADAVYSVVFTLVRPEHKPTINEVENALVRPYRPLFIGRKCCLPASPVLVGRREGSTLLGVLRALPRPRRSTEGKLLARWPADEDSDIPGARLVPVTDDRDWTNQIHVGRRWVHEGWIDA